jgi:hypothetical protein
MSLYKVIINRLTQPDPDRYQKAYAHEKVREKATQNAKIISVVGICVCVYLWFYLAFNAF